jgi:ribosomal protein S14
MNASLQLNTPRRHSGTGIQRCVLCGNKQGDLLFKGYPLCRTCVAYMKELS